MRVLHPDLSAAERERLFQEGIDLFNQGRFFEAHEAWEEIWRSTTPEPRDLFQGLIQVAAALHQFLDLKRIDGPRRTLAKARRRLEPYAPAALGIDVKDLLEQVRTLGNVAGTAAKESRRPCPPSIQNPKSKIQNQGIPYRRRFSHSALRLMPRSSAAFPWWPRV